MTERRRRWVGMVAAVLAAGCAGEGAGRDSEPAAPLPAAADSALDSALVLSPGLPDTTALAAPPSPSPALPADVPTATPPTPAPPSAAPAEGDRGWTAGIVEARRPAVRMTTLLSVRSARNEGFDRVVFEFAGDQLPGYHLEYVDRPVRACGSGDTVPMGGDGWLEVRLEPARAHDESGRATVTDRARRPDLPNLVDLRATCDFEGQVVWVLGLRSPNPYRVLRLEAPARIVVDVRH